MKRHQLYWLLPWAAITLLASIYAGSITRLFDPPVGVHQWRQADCAGIARMYSEHDLSFAQPETMNQNAGGNLSGKCATSEMPLLYYSTAMLWKAFGQRYWIYRLFVFAIWHTGSLAAFALLRRAFANATLGSAVYALWLIGAVHLHYSTSFLSNVPATAISHMGLWAGVSARAGERNSLLWLATGLFALAACLKISAAMVGLAFFGATAIEQIWKRRWPWLTGLQAIAMLAPAALWIVYANAYNQQFGCGYFSTTIYPIWKMNWPEIHRVYSDFRSTWDNHYYNLPQQLILLAVMASAVIYWLKMDLFHRSLLLLFAVGFSVHIASQYGVLHQHDYYLFDYYSLVLVLWISAAPILKPSAHFRRPINVVAFAIAIFALNNASRKIDGRTKSYHNGFEATELTALQPWLEQKGVAKHDLILTTGDVSNASLFLLNRRGWCQFTPSVADTIVSAADSLHLTEMKTAGLRFALQLKCSQPSAEPTVFGFTELVGDTLGHRLWRLPSTN